MECRDLREMADSFLSGELLTETNHEILRHLATCADCRREVDARRTLRISLRRAFEGAPDLSPREDFARELRDRLREKAFTPVRRRSVPGGWLALAATILLAVAVGSAFWMRARIGDELAALAAGDHRNCALRFRLTEKPVSMDEAARRFGPEYRLLQAFPPIEIRTAAGNARVLERHSCVYNGRRFAHIVMRYNGEIISLLVTPTDASALERIAMWHAPATDRRMEALSVVSRSAPGHAIFLVGAPDASALAPLADAVSTPLAQRLTGV